MLVVEARKQWQIDLGFFLGVAVVGLAIWLAVSAVSGKKEVWESDYFYNVGFPCMALVSGVAGFLRPNRPSPPWQCNRWRSTGATTPSMAESAPLGFFSLPRTVALAFCAVGGAALRHRN